MGDPRRIKTNPAIRKMLSQPAAFRPQRRQRPRRGTLRLFMAIGDYAQVLAVGLALCLAFQAAPALDLNLSPGRVAGIGLLAATLALFVRRGLRRTSAHHVGSTYVSSVRSAAAVMIAFSGIAVGRLLLGSTTGLGGDLLLLMSWAVISTALAAALRLLGTRLIAGPESLTTNIVVLGPSPQAGALARILTERSRGHRQVLAVLQDDMPENMVMLDQLIEQGEVDIIALAGMDAEGIQAICEEFGDRPVHICVGFDAVALERAARGSSHLDDPVLLRLLPGQFDDWRDSVKRGLDIALVMASLPLIAPVLIMAAIAIKLDSPGPVFFRQWRFGLGTQPVQILKFRSMYTDRGDTTGEARTTARDSRVTRVGRILRRTSIDELPQLLNVLRGDMSLVGPRPHATHMKVEGNYYFEAVEHYRLRHRVKPGLTGWAQVNGSRGEVDTLDKAYRRVDLDLWYINNWSITLDLKIIFKTVFGGFATLKAD
ncbi:Glycosyltransferase protein PslA [Roseomonas mucosa]|uniref:sugar transferase n=1 Tax=Roseomonas mucosa TaxID=207340 RepID=UPI002209944E|nr:sugar transferase [Roseomonas mucosa]QDJ08317.1 Glycosyltransferase protein PslA [Roseomonas mucosa]